MNEKLVNALYQIPKAAGIKNWQQIGDAGKAMYNAELRGEGFTREGLSAEERLWPYLKLLENPKADQAVIAYGKAILKAASHGHDVHKAATEEEQAVAAEKLKTAQAVADAIGQPAGVEYSVYDAASIWG